MKKKKLTKHQKFIIRRRKFLAEVLKDQKKFLAKQPKLK